MRRAAVLIVAALCLGGALTPLVAQKTAPPVTRDADHDGVPDPFDRCPNTPIGAHVDANGCAPGQLSPAVPAAPAAAPAQQTIAPQAAPGSGSASQPAASPALTTSQSATAARPGGASPAATASATPPSGQTSANAAASRPAPPPPASGNPGSLPNVSLPATPPPVATSAASPPPGATTSAANRPAQPSSGAPAPSAGRPAAPTATIDVTLTSGYMMPGWVPNSRLGVAEYVRGYLLKLDSAALALRAVFNNIPGQPVEGATDPTRLVSREKIRWRNCRNFKNDFQSFADAVAPLRDSMPAVMRDRWLELGDRFDSLEISLENCETIAFMIESPERYQPWQQNYESAARAFYADWYLHLRAMHEAARAVARLDAQLVPADHRASLVIPNLPSAAPTLGGN